MIRIIIILNSIILAEENDSKVQVFMMILIRLGPVVNIFFFFV